MSHHESSNNQPTSSIPQYRPGRTTFKQSQTIDIQASYGSSHWERDPSSLRIFFQNTKGLTYSSTGEDYDYYLTCTKSLGANIIGMAETNTSWQHPHLRYLFSSRARKHYHLIKATFSSPTSEIDPVPEKETFQSGGTITLTTGDYVPMIFGEDPEDNTGLGRWSSQTLRGKNNKIFTAITGYRVCSGSISTSSIGSAFSREYEYHRTQRNVKSPRPRKLFLSDLQAYIHRLQEKGHAILLMLDSNGQLHDDQDLQHFAATCDLHDLHQSDPAPSTYIGSDHRRIDHMMGCSHTLASLRASGSLSYLDGPQSDHRGLYVDLDTSTLLDQLTTPLLIAAPNTRPLKAGNPESIEAYTQSMLQYYAEHHMVTRMQDLRATFQTLSRSDLKKKLEKWDSDQGRAMEHAESQLRHSPKAYAWSPALRDAGLLYRYWRLRLREIQHGSDYAGTFEKIERTASQHNPEFCLPFKNLALTLTETRYQLQEATKTLKLRQQDSVELRYRSYTDLLAVYENDQNPTTKSESNRKAKIVANTIRSEQCRAMFNNIRQVVKSTNTGGLTKIQVPRHKNHPNYPKDYQTFLAETTEEDIIWDTLLDKQSINTNLLRYNRNSFRAAAVSPCGHGKIHDHLTFNSLSLEAAELLSGTIPADWYGDDELLREFLTSFAIPESVKATAPIPTDITNDQVLTGFRKWKETTSTSPSGRHLGHYKAITHDAVLLQCLTDFLHITVNSGLPVTRWCNAVNILIEKDPGKPKINRLRIIHLFEADFNYFLKLIWGSRLVKRATTLNLLNDGQHGSVPRRTAMDPIMLTQLTTDLCRLLKHNLARFDNDASACYDRIIVSLGMLAARRCGMPDHAVRTHADSLKLMKYTVKTVHGISEDNYQGTPFSPLFGTGQGSGASPAVWLTLIVTLMNTLDRLIPERMEFTSPDTSMHHSRLIDAFVDDTSLGFTDAGYLTLETIIAKLNNMAQTWEKLLFYSGGALNLSKCSWYVLFWDWKQGRPQARLILPTDPTLQLTTQGTDNPIPIKRLPLDHASRILGVHLSPDGNFAKQLTVLKEKADGFAIKLRSPRLTPQDIHTFHRTMYTPAMKYVLPALAVDEEELGKVQTKVLASMLQKLGYSSKTPTAVRHGPIELGGLNLMDLRTELGISNLKYFRDAVYTESEAGKLIILNVKYSQIESGIAEPLFEHPSIRIPYLTPSWIMSVRQFMSQHNVTLTMTDTLKVELRGPTDQCIMNLESLTRYPTSKKHDINLVRLYLQVITLSDMSTPDGLDACPYMSEGIRNPTKHIRHKTWPRQTQPTAAQITTWKHYIETNYLRHGTRWKNKLELPPAQPSPSPPTEYLPRSPIHFTTFHEHIKSLPTWYRRLLFDYRQVATDLEVWRAFRAKRRLIIASDGSLTHEAGTFGWKLTTEKFKPLFQGSGPVDGPIEIGSSTRSELGGFTAPLLLVTILARHWGLKHRCSFRWLADSKVALHRVSIVTRHDHTPTKQPDNSDYIAVIEDLFKELRRPMQAQWVKSHQDSRTPYHKLTDEAKLNVDADELATLFHLKPKGKPMRSTPHIPATKISISILKIRYAGNFDDNLRYHINGGYLRGHLQHTNKWTDTVWNTIDIHSFGRHIRRVPLIHQPAHLKLIHNQLPLGLKKFRISTVADESLRLCPCCKIQVEDNQHLLQCIHNPARVEAEKVLLNSLLSDPHPSRPAFASCIEQYLEDSTEIPTFTNERLPQHLKPILDEAIHEQSQVGWHQLLLGFLSTQWLHLAASDPHVADKMDKAAGQHRIQQILNHLFTFTRSIWLGRNDILHKEQDTVDTHIYSMESAELRHYHANPTLLPTSDQHYCSLPLQRLLRSRPSVRRRWLRRVKTARAAFLQNGKQQQRITQFLEVSRTPDHLPPAPNIAFRPGLTRSTTTQQRMTDYFPGRPPDPTHPSTPSNPSPSHS